jgi:protoporphyrinogen oxidase
MPQKALIIGAGPAGLTTALELTRRTAIQPIVLEASLDIGGISRTVRYKGNRMDIGGHRFFSKSDRVMQWWADLMPPENSTTVSYHGQSRSVAVPAHLSQEPPLRGMGPLEPSPGSDSSPDVAAVVAARAPQDPDLVMLIRPRRSRIYYLRRFFDYPISLSAQTLRQLGLRRVLRIGASYLAARLRQCRPERSLADFLINRFGRELYLTFFKSYTEKVWGTPCERISAEWGAQRIKGLSLSAAVRHYLHTQLAPRKAGHTQENTETSLIERFLYPKFGPGQLWEHVAALASAAGAQLHTGWRVDSIEPDRSCPQRVAAVHAVNASGELHRHVADHFISTMPIKDLVRAMGAGGFAIPDEVRAIAEGLEYRDFITVGLLVRRLAVTEPTGGLLRDTWLYIQEPDVLLGRVQLFNNWSPHLVADPDTVWLGLEYFCREGDSLWQLEDSTLARFAASELAKIGLLRVEDVLDATVVRVPKSYPGYFGAYEHFDVLRAWLDRIENLYLIGRNGMHKYNNQDHSMLTAMTLVDGLATGLVDRTALWSINTEPSHHETR